MDLLPSHWRINYISELASTCKDGPQNAGHGEDGQCIVLHVTTTNRQSDRIFHIFTVMLTVALPHETKTEIFSGKMLNDSLIPVPEILIFTPCLTKVRYLIFYNLEKPESIFSIHNF